MDDMSVRARASQSLFGTSTSVGGWLVLSTLVNSVGNGLYISGSALYFSRQVGLDARQISIGIGASALMGIAAAVPIGRATDRLDPRAATVVNMTLGGLGMMLMLLVNSFWVFILVSCVVGVVAGASQAIRPALIRSQAGSELVSLRSGMVSAANLGIALGALLGGFALQSDDGFAYRMLLVGNAVSFLVCALVTLRLPPVPAVTRERRQRGFVTRDRAFVVVTLVSSLISIHTSVLTFALPLWIVNQTAAPAVTFTVALLVNTGMIVLLQTTVGRRVATPVAAVRALAVAAAAAGVSFVLIGSAEMATTGAAVALLVAGAAVLTAAEMAHAAADLEFSYGLAPPDRQGEYSGFYFIGIGLSRAVAPALFAATCLSFGVKGWLGVAAFFGAAVLVVPWVLLREVRRHHQQEERR